MNHAIIRSVRTSSLSSLSLFQSPLQSSTFARKPSRINFRQATTVVKQPGNTTNSKNMDQGQMNPNEKNGDVMSHSFGEGYATRSDEEGFGGIYGGNQSLPSVDIDKKIHENHPAYDKTQGSEASEKETSRNQCKADNSEKNI